jgi:hypothetical protein
MDLFSKMRISLQSSTLWLVIGLAFVCASAHGGEIFKWVDEEGNVHYSQDPPMNKSSRSMNIKVPKTPAASEDSDAQTASPADTTQQAADEDKAADQKARQEAAAKKQEEAQKKNCQIAMKRLATITAGGRLYEVDEKGERHYWDDQTLQAKKVEAQKDVDQWCGQE